MTRTGKDTPADGERGADCPSIEALETLLRDDAAQPSEAMASHLKSCSRCRELLDEMRSANRFLERFNSGEGLASTRHEGPHEGPGQRVVRIHGYEIEKLLAFGGQGSVYKARQKATGRDVAIKVPIGDTQRRPSTRYRFQREIELTARLDHPGIVRVFGDCELDDGRIGCVMEFVEGEPFDRWAARERVHGRAGTRRIIEVMSLVADAIAYAHQRAVMHRDIKPSNVVVTAEGAPRVLDFGLAKALDESGKSFATLTGAFIGTLVYAAPEQIGDGHDGSDLRTDVYALGLLLFQSLTGRLPFATDAPTTEILRHIRETPPPRPSSLSQDIGTELDAIMLKALAKEKERRYPSSAELRDDLRAWLDGRAVRARFDSRWYVLYKALRRHRWAVSGAAIILILGVALGVATLNAREQSTRARIADAVRDARTVESFRVQMSEARAISRDSFALGERTAWDALLNPEPILVAQRLEGAGPSGPLPMSPARWALWEIYARTPVLASLPEETDLGAVFTSASDRIVSLRGNRVTWWDWRHGMALRRFDLPINAGIAAWEYLGNPERFQVLDQNHRLVLIDADQNAATLPNDPEVAHFMAEAERLFIHRFVPNGPRIMELWDTTSDPPSLLASHTMRAPNASVRTMTFDGSGRFFALADEAGEIVILDATTGRVLFDRPPGEQPLLVWVGSRGRPGEFFALGPGGAQTIQISPESEVAVQQFIPKLGALDTMKTVIQRGANETYLFITDRQQVGVGHIDRPLAEGSLIPALTAMLGDISPDGRHAVLGLLGSGRKLILDLKPAVVRRLPFPTGPSPNGAGTVFDIEFSPDGRSLDAGAMDGSVRTFALPGGECTTISSNIEERGVCVIATSGNDVLVGSHNLSHQGARLVLLTPGEEPRVLAETEHRFCGLVAEPGVAAWALTGGGRLLRIDLPSGNIVRDVRLAEVVEYPLFRALTRAAGGGPLIVASARDGLLLVDPDTLKPLGPPLALDTVRGIAASPTDPDMFASCADDGLIRLWRMVHTEPPSVELVRAFGAHAGPAYCLAFHPGGRLLASGGGSPESKDVRLWDTETGEELAALNLFENGVFDVAFSPDGRWLAAGGEIRLDHPEEGGQLFLIDLQEPDECIAGNLEYQIGRFAREQGHEPSQAAALRAWAERVRDAEPAGP